MSHRKLCVQRTELFGRQPPSFNLHHRISPRDEWKIFSCRLEVTPRDLRWPCIGRSVLAGLHTPYKCQHHRVGCCSVGLARRPGRCTLQRPAVIYHPSHKDVISARREPGKHRHSVRVRSTAGAWNSLQQAARLATSSLDSVQRALSGLPAGFPPGRACH